MSHTPTPAALLSTVLLAAGINAPVAAGEAPSNEALAKATQNPLANLISLPFQNDTYFHVGPDDKTLNVLNIEPVIPIKLTEDWNLITRTIIPIISQPAVIPGGDRSDGLGDIQVTGFLSPANPKGLIWGIGTILQMPTNTEPDLGNDRWGVGPSFVALHEGKKGDPWVIGALVNNVWSVGSSNDPAYNTFTLQPFINYNFTDGLYATFSPIVTADWMADSNDRWTVPLGGGLGKIIHLGKIPTNISLSAFYNVVSPDEGPDWSVRAQLSLLFPE